MKQIGDGVCVERDMEGIELSIEGDRPRISMSPDAIANLVAWLRAEGFLPEQANARRDMFAAAALQGLEGEG